MPIEFNCHVCGKLLKTADEKAGRIAKCPGCGEEITVPGGEADTQASMPGDDFGTSQDDADDYGDEFDTMPAVTDAGTRPCPMCGEQISRGETRCQFCGENVGSGKRSGRGDVGPREIEVGEVISTAWEIYKSQLGLCVGGFVIMFVIMLVIAFARGLCTNLIGAAMAGGGGPNQQPGGGALALIAGIGLIASLIEFAIRTFLEAGLKRMLLSIARGKEAEIGDLFSAGPFYLRYLGCSILFGLMVGFGSLACIVPGILLALMFWPFTYLILDRDLPGIESLGRAKEITQGNWGSIFVLALAAIGINLLGFLMLCVGILFTAPLTMLMFTVAYCRLSGRATARI